MKRREFTALAGTAAALALLSEQLAALEAAGNGPLTVTCLIHPDMVMLDLIAPLTVFNLMRADVRLVSREGGPVASELGLPVAATNSFVTAPAYADVFFIPGGLAGSVRAMADEATVDFVREFGGRANWVTSVCTGSLLLAAAGLLQGYRATSHWYVRDLLSLAGAEVDTARVVEDRNRLTGGGVTAGLDFGLQLAARLRGEDLARTIQLVLEYDPAPPFDAGSPEQAGTALTQSVLSRRSELIDGARAALLRYR